MRISYGGTTWNLGWWSGSLELDDAVEFSDRRGALLFLLSFKSAPQFMGGLRYLLVERNRGYAFSRASDQQVLEEIAWLIASRQLLVKCTYHAVEGMSAKEEAATPLPPPPPPPRPPAPPAESPDDEPVFMPNIDAAAIAAVQREAAQSGVPFCEE